MLDIKERAQRQQTRFQQDMNKCVHNRHNHHDTFVRDDQAQTGMVVVLPVQEDALGNFRYASSGMIFAMHPKLSTRFQT
jgi:hypothetical protein